MKEQAAALARQGRFGDSEIVHVSKAELRGLEALQGGPLPRNPTTGMPEAFGLGSILGLIGSIGGVALAPFTGGSSLLMSSLGGGLGGTLGGLLEGKDFGSSLGGGILSGLLGYGAGSALGGLATAGTDEIAKETAAELGRNGVQAATSAAGATPAGYGVASPEMGWGGASADALGTSAPAYGVASPEAGWGGAGGGLGDAAGRVPFGPPQMSPWQQVGDQLDRVGRGASSPEALWNTFGKNGLSTTAPIAAGLYGMSLDGSGSNQDGAPQPQHSYPTLPGPNQRRYMPPPRGWDYSTGKEWNYFTPAFAGGGLATMAPHALGPDGKPIQDSQSPLDMFMGGGGANAPMSPQLKNILAQFLGGSLKPMAGGGAVNGPGSGLDDAIPAVINGRQPAKLSSGEWVAPAHFVSALGNGSTQDGVRQLDGMVDKTMMAKYGTTNRKPRPINPQRMMPFNSRGG